MVWQLIYTVYQVFIGDKSKLKINTDLFLDDKNIKEVENQLNTEIHVLDGSNDIIDILIGKSNKTNHIKNA